MCLISPWAHFFILSHDKTHFCSVSTWQVASKRTVHRPFPFQIRSPKQSISGLVSAVQRLQNVGQYSTFPFLGSSRLLCRPRKAHDKDKEPRRGNCLVPAQEWGCKALSCIRGFGCGPSVCLFVSLTLLRVVENGSLQSADEIMGRRNPAPGAACAVGT